jgi:hypothetical protein
MIHESDGEADWLILIENRVKIILDYGVCLTVIYDGAILQEETHPSIGV